MITSQENIVRKIKNVRGKIFTVEFLKKDGTLRRMVCRKEVKKFLKGGTRHSTPGLIVVCDMEAAKRIAETGSKESPYRSFHISSIGSLTVDGVTYRPKYLPR